MEFFLSEDHLLGSLFEVFHYLLQEHWLLLSGMMWTLQGLGTFTTGWHRTPPFSKELVMNYNTCSHLLATSPQPNCLLPRGIEWQSLIRVDPRYLLASSPGCLLKNGGRREPGNICGRSCRLPAPCSGGTNQIAEQNHMYMWHFVHSAKICQLNNELLPGIVPILHGRLFNHMTIITKVGVSYIDHMNDDAPEVDSFLHTLSGSLLPPVFEESLEQGYPSPNISNN